MYAVRLVLRNYVTCLALAKMVELVRHLKLAFESVKSIINIYNTKMSILLRYHIGTYYLPSPSSLLKKRFLPSVMTVSFSNILVLFLNLGMFFLLCKTISERFLLYSFYFTFM